MVPPLTTSVEPPPSADMLESAWRGLEAGSDGSFFLSWTWIGAWLRATGAAPLLVTTRQSGESGESGEIVGLGLLCRHAARRRLLRIPSLYLHETGPRGPESVFVEHNGILAARGREREVAGAVLGHLAGCKGNGGAADWRELHLGGVPGTYATLLSDLGLAFRIDAERPSPYVDLDRVRGANDDYLSLLSRNRRHKISRAMRLYAERGALRVARAETAETARAWLAEMARLHEARWAQHGQEGAFARPAFRRFVAHLIEAGAESGAVDLLEIRAGAHAAGYLLNFVHRGVVSNYQGGFAYEADNRLTPGLVSHAAAIAYYAARRDVMRYDFLAGHAAYKTSLATDEEMLYWITVEHARGLLGLERQARRMAARFGRP